MAISSNLIGTVWLAANSYNLSNAIGSVNLANSTAETFVQHAKNTPIIAVQNCFSCHNAVSFSSKSPPLARAESRTRRRHAVRGTEPHFRQAAAQAASAREIVANGG